MPRALPIQSCLKSGCRNLKLGLFNHSVNPQQSAAIRRSTILQSPQQSRLGCGSNGKIPVGYDVKGNPIRDEKGNIVYMQGCSKTKQGITYTKLQKINGFGRFTNQSGGLNDPQKGGLVVRNF